MGISDTIKEYYNKNLTEKIINGVTKAKGFKLGLDENIEGIKKKYDKYARKDINLSFIDRLTRAIYANPYHLAKVEFIQYIFFIILIYYYNPLNINTKYPSFTKLLVLSVSFIYVMLFIWIKMRIENNDDVDYIDPTESNIIIKFISIIVFFVVFVMCIKGITWLLSNTALINVIHNMLGLFIFVVVLGIIYLFMRKTINKAKNAPGRKFSTLVLKFIMYLPCLLVDIVEYVKYQLNLTTKPVWILLGIEGTLVGLYFIVPYLFDKLLSSDGLKLLNQPIYLSEEHTLGNYNELRKKKTKKSGVDETDMNMDEMYSTKINEEVQADIDSSNNSLANEKPNKYTDPNIPKNKYLAWIYNKLQNPVWIKIQKVIRPQYTDTNIKRYRYSYSLSGWFYINPQPPNTRTAYTRYTNILRYGNKVNVEYNGQLGSLRVMADVATSGTDIINNPNDSIEIYETKKVLYQRWNNIVINYDEGYLDIFINGELVGSKSGVAPYMTHDSIVVGADTGILGGICNVTYYDRPLNKSNIELMYKALQGKKNPYIWRLKDDFNINIKSKKDEKFINKIKKVLTGA